MKTIIHVNQHVIRRNTKTGDSEPCLTVKDYKQNRYASQAVIKGPDGAEVARVVYSPHKATLVRRKVLDRDAATGRR